MGWRDFKIRIPTDKIDINDKNHPGGIFVDIVDIVDRVQLIKKPEATNIQPSSEKPIWKNPYPQVTQEARQHTLAVTMDAMIEQVVIEFKSAGYSCTSEVQKVEQEVQELYSVVLNGSGSLADFEKALKKWWHIGSEKVSDT